jgi:hypothetical protein
MDNSIFIQSKSDRLFPFILILLVLVLPPAIIRFPQSLKYPYTILGCLLGFSFIFKKTFTTRYIALFTFVGSTLCFIVVLDLATRPIFNAPVYLYTHPNVLGLNRISEDVAVRWETYGNLSSMLGNPEFIKPRKVHYVTDAYGFRNYEAFPDTVYDLILVGDSFGVGAGVSQEQTWGVLFSNTFKLKTYNLSTVGGPWAGLMNLKLEKNRLKTKKGTMVLWAIFCGNDLSDNYRDSMEPEFASFAQRIDIRWNTFRKRSPIRQALDKILLTKETRKEIVVRRFDGGYMLFHTAGVETIDRSLEEVYAHPNYPRMKKTFQEMHRVSIQNGIEVVVAILPYKEEIYRSILTGKLNEHPWNCSGDNFSDAVAQLSHSEGFRYLDLKPLFCQEAERRFQSKRESLWYPDDTHWNPNGHEFAASEVFKNLLSRR